jgi:hypothetical protein
MNLEETYALLKTPVTDVRIGAMTKIIERSLKSLNGFTYKRALVSLSRDDVEAIYQNVPSIILELNVHSLASRDLIGYKIRGPGALDRIALLKGTHTSPSKCDKMSWRWIMFRRFGCRIVAVRRLPSRNLIRTPENYVHTPTASDYAANADVFLKLFKS